MTYPASAIAYQFDDDTPRSPLYGRKRNRLAVVDGVKQCRCGRGPLAPWSQGKCRECDREQTRARRAKR